MKRIKYVIAIIVIATISTTIANAQVAFTAGFSVPTYKIDNGVTQTVTNYTGYGFKAGAEYDAHVKGGFHFVPGVYWSYTTAGIKSILKDVKDMETLHEHSIDITLHGQWNFDIKPDIFGMFVYAGPVISLGMSSKSETVFNVPGSSGIIVRGSYNYYDGYCEVAKDDLGLDLPDNWADELMVYLRESSIRHKRYDIRADFGVGFNIKENYNIMLGYNLGFINKYGKINYDSKITTSHFYIAFRYRLSK